MKAKGKTTKSKPKNKAVNVNIPETYGLIQDEKKVFSQEAYIRKIMTYLGYDLKRAAGYRYYTKSNRPINANFKEKVLNEVFEK